jgi:cell wall-associated NlpC family hydrolase
VRYVPALLPHQAERKKQFTTGAMSLIVAAMKKMVATLAGLIAFGVLPALAADEIAKTAAVPPATVAAAGGGYLDRAGELVIHALALIGINYKYDGDSADRGFDCSGLVSYVFHEVIGLTLPRDSQAMSRVGKKVGKTELQPGDLVFFNTRRRPFSHVGIYIGEERFVHAPSRGRDVEVSNLHSRYWNKRYNGARRVSF